MQDDLRARIREFAAAAPVVIEIDGVGGRRWKRKVAKGARIGPWQQARYRVVDSPRWSRRAPCLYLVSGYDGDIRYVGVSKNRLKDRWRTSPALDAETMELLPAKELFHSQCMKHIEMEFAEGSEASFRIHGLFADELVPWQDRLGIPRLSAGVHDSELVLSAERWLRDRRSSAIVPWNAL
jgi:hypothetical protein